MAKHRLNTSASAQRNGIGQEPTNMGSVFSAGDVSIDSEPSIQPSDLLPTDLLGHERLNPPPQLRTECIVDNPVKVMG